MGRSDETRGEWEARRRARGSSSEAGVAAEEKQQRAEREGVIRAASEAARGIQRGDLSGAGRSKQPEGSQKAASNSQQCQKGSSAAR